MTPSFVAFLGGLLLIVVAIFGGGLEVREFKIANLSPLSRILSFILGCALLAIFFVHPEWLGAPSPIPPQEAATHQADVAKLTKSQDELKLVQEREAQQKKTIEDLTEAAKKFQDEAEQARKSAEQLAGRAEADAALARAELAMQEAKTKRAQAEAEKEKLKQLKAEVSDKQRVKDVLQERVDNPARAKAASIIGYSVFSVINTQNRPRKTYFSIDGRNDARFPIIDDLMEIAPGRDKVALRSYPYRWDPKKKGYSQGEATAYLTPGQKVRVGGYMYVSTDPDNGEQYLVVSLAEALNFSVEKSGLAVFSIDGANTAVAGYVYFGKVDDKAEAFSEKIFENETRPTSVFPAANDRLRALTGANIRNGPKFWDDASKKYVNSPKVGQIDEGQKVLVGGDPVLAKGSDGGISIWVPVNLAN